MVSFALLLQITLLTEMDIFSVTYYLPASAQSSCFHANLLLVAPISYTELLKSVVPMILTRNQHQVPQVCLNSFAEGHRCLSGKLPQSRRHSPSTPPLSMWCRSRAADCHEPDSTAIVFSTTHPHHVNSLP